MKVAYFEGARPDAGSSPTVWPSTGELSAWMSPDRADGVVWWIPDRHEPTVAEARTRFDFLRTHGPSPYAFTPQQTAGAFTIERVWLDDADVQLLIAQLNADLYARYPEPGALVFRLDPADIVDGVGVLLMAQYNGRNVGCGAFRVIDDQPGTAEIKRMYVAPSVRGRKIGAAMLAELELRACAIGVTRFVLETGPRQPESIALYHRAGYAECEPWGEFIGKDFTVCMERVASR